MTEYGPVDRENLNTGCPGGPPIPGIPFTLEVGISAKMLIRNLRRYDYGEVFMHELLERIQSFDKKPN